MPDYSLSDTAKTRLQEIARYTEKTWGRLQMERYIASLFHAFETLACGDRRGAPQPLIEEGLYRYHCEKHYIFYSYVDTHMVVVDLLHERMDPSLHLTFNQ